MKSTIAFLLIGFAVLLGGPTTCHAGESALENAYARWKNGPPKDPSFFPLAVWLQDPSNAEKYKALGINTYVALWEGPTDQQLAALKKSGMFVICDQNEVALKHREETGVELHRMHAHR